MVHSSLRFLASVFLLAIVTACVCTTHTVVDPISLGANGEFANGDCTNPKISADGRFVAFSCEADNLVPGVAIPNHSQVYVHDRTTGTTELISLDSQGQPINGRSIGPSISNDGRLVTFLALANGVVPGDEQNLMQYKVYVRNRQTGTTLFVSRTTDGMVFTQDSMSAVLIPNGEGVYFTSKKFDPTGPSVILYHSLDSRETKELRHNAGSMQFVLDAINSGTPVPGVVMSSNLNGAWLVLRSPLVLPYILQTGSLTVGTGFGPPVPGALSPRLYLYNVPYDQNFQADVSQTHQLDRSPSGGSNSLFGIRAAFSSESHCYLSQNNSSSLPPQCDSNDIEDVFVFDSWNYTHSGSGPYFWRASENFGGVDADGRSFGPVMIGSEHVAFVSEATNLITGDTNGKTDVFLKNLTDGSVEILSRGGIDGVTQSNDDSGAASCNEDGDVIAFQSKATNLVSTPANTDGKSQIYVWRRYQTCK